MIVRRPALDQARFAPLAICVLLCAFGCAQAANRSAAAPPLPLPGIKKDCSACHVMKGNRRTDALTKNPSALCLDCHPGRLAPSEHKVDIVPSMKVTGLPLTDGKMTCVTCHDPHENRHGSLLRMPETALCLTCHLL